MPQFTDLSRVARVALAAAPFIKGLQPAQATFRTAWSAKDAGGTTQISYSFPWADGAASKFTAPYGKGENTAATTGAVTGPQAAQIAKAFDAWSNVARIAFTPVAETAGGEVGDIRVAFTSAIGPGYWGYSLGVSDGMHNAHGDIWIDKSMIGQSFAPGTYNFTAMMHEIGHSLGLKHSFEAIWDAGEPDTFSVAAFSGGCTLDLKPGAYSSLAYTTVSLTQNIGIAFGCTIENALGGDGGDTFRFASLADLPGTAANAADVIMDFSRAQGDRIDGGPALVAGDVFL